MDDYVRLPEVWGAVHLPRLEELFSASDIRYRSLIGEPENPADAGHGHACPAEMWVHRDDLDRARRLLPEDVGAALERVRGLTARDLRQKGIFQLLASAAEELAELSRELLVEESVFGNTYKKGDEGSRAEAADLAICALALFFGRGGTPEELADTLHRKLDKWQRKHTKA